MSEQTPATVFDQLHAWFGIGSYDEATSKIPWHRARIVEIAKLKALLKSRRASLAEVLIAAEYARAQHRVIHETWQVFALIPEAMRERFRDAATARREERRAELADAIAEATELGETEWAHRLVRAQDSDEVLAAWRNR